MNITNFRQHKSVMLIAAISVICFVFAILYIAHGPNSNTVRYHDFQKEVNSFALPGGTVVFQSISSKGCVSGDTDTPVSQCYLDAEKDFTTDENPQATLTTLVQYIQSRGYSLPPDQASVYKTDIAKGMTADDFKQRWPYSKSFQKIAAHKTLDLEIGTKHVVSTEKTGTSGAYDKLDNQTIIYSVRFVQ